MAVLSFVLFSAYVVSIDITCYYIGTVTAYRTVSLIVPNICVFQIFGIAMNKEWSSLVLMYF